MVKLIIIKKENYKINNCKNKKGKEGKNKFNINFLK